MHCVDQAKSTSTSLKSIKKECMTRVSRGIYKNCLEQSYANAWDTPYVPRPEQILVRWPWRQHIFRWRWTSGLAHRDTIADHSCCSDIHRNKVKAPVPTYSTFSTYFDLFRLIAGSSISFDSIVRCWEALPTLQLGPWQGCRDARLSLSDARAHLHRAREDVESDIERCLSHTFYMIPLAECATCCDFFVHWLYGLEWLWLGSVKTWLRDNSIHAMENKKATWLQGDWFSCTSKAKHWCKVLTQAKGSDFIFAPSQTLHKNATAKQICLS